MTRSNDKIPAEISAAKTSKPKFRRRSEARPDEVLDAALALFIEKGFAATRVDDIAKRAGISKGAVYLYFASKEALLEGLVQRAIVPATDGALSMMGGLDGHPREVLTLFMHGLAANMQNPNFFAVPKIVMREALVAPQIAAMYRARVLDRVIPILTGVIAKGIAEGQFRPVDPELAVRSIMGPVIAHILLAEIFGIKPENDNVEALINTHTTILFDGLFTPEGAQ